MGRFFGVTCAVVLHVAFILFGGLLVGGAKEAPPTLQEVELLSADDSAAEKDAKNEPDPVASEKEAMEEEIEEVPDADKIIRELEPPAVSAGRLDDASLSAIADALRGLGGSGDFGLGTDFTSGGRIGGVGKASALDDQVGNAFDLTEIDQEPRAIFQATPPYPAELRGKKIEGVVSVVFVVDATGKVLDPKVEKSTHPAFNKPALDAVRKWKFEPGIKAGQRVPRRVRVPIRFQPS
jgi:protein TonB